MLDYLERNFDEAWLRTNYLPKKLRCQSIIQSYNIFDSKDYYDAYGNCWLLKAEMILRDPLITQLSEKKGRAANEDADQSAVGISQRALVKDSDEAAGVPRAEIVVAEEPDVDKSEGNHDIKV